MGGQGAKPDKLFGSIEGQLLNQHRKKSRLSPDIITRSDKGNPAGRYSLLTGGTGLVGRYLIRDLFLKGRNLVVIVRSNSRLTAQQRIENILQRWELELDITLPRPVVFEGDITKPNLGLTDQHIEWLTDHCDTVIHNAAVLKFNGACLDEDPWRTNLTGTKNVLALANAAEITNLHYVSTAYVCGNRNERVREDELECGQKFRNDYEQSKYRAEQLVHEAEGFATKTIYRPGVIVGDSKSGYTSTYHGLYLYLRLIATLVPHQPRNELGKLETPIQLPMNGDEPRNLVPVDWVSSVIAQIVCDPSAHNRTFHLTPDKCVTAAELLEHCYAYFNSTGVVFAGENSEAIGGSESQFADEFFRSTQIYEDYNTTDPEFDKSNVLEFAGNLPCPILDREMVFRFIEYGQADKWGKRREKAPQVTRWFEAELEGVVDGLDQMSRKDNDRLAINVFGPGGGQWHLQRGIDGSFQVHDGLPIEPVQTLKLDQGQVEWVLDGQLATANATSSDVWASLFKQFLPVSG